MYMALIFMNILIDDGYMRDYYPVTGRAYLKIHYKFLTLLCLNKVLM